MDGDSARGSFHLNLPALDGARIKILRVTNVTAARDDVIRKIWRGHDPFSGFPKGLYAVDKQGWRSNHHYLPEAVTLLSPKVVVEMGVWKGASVITLADRMKALGLDGVVIAVDTWLGSSELWANDEWFEMMSVELGRPSLQRKFMANIVDSGLEDYVVPLPLDSYNAAVLLHRANITVDLIHLDGSHHYASVLSDLTAWWPLLRSGGMLIGDDYVPSYQGVVPAFDDFFGEKNIPITSDAGKCQVRKP